MPVSARREAKPSGGRFEPGATRISQGLEKLGKRVGKCARAGSHPLLAALALILAPPAVAKPDSVKFREVTFTGYTPLASAAELARRTLTPLDAGGLKVQPGQQFIDLGSEQFIMRVPATPPSGRFGVLVFIPPWNDGRVPEGWAPALDRFGFIFVAALRSGNDQDIMGRREPLAILAADNVADLYPVDRDRILVGGFSGGSRVAMRLALAYPDLFRGALLDAGSDPIGNRVVPLPPRDLFDRFRQTSRVAYVTGALDEASLQLDVESILSMRRWCMSNISARRVPGLGHDLIDGSALATALTQLLRPPADAARTASCAARTVAGMQSKLDEAARLAGSDPRAAQGLVERIDHEYGGLAVPRLTDLARRLADGRR